MKKLLMVFLLMSSLPSVALVAPRKYIADSSCPKEAPFKEMGWNFDEDDGEKYLETHGDCISCNTTRALMLENPKDCDLCPNRTVNEVGELGGWIQTNYCRLKKCPPDKPFYEEKWNWSGCKSCEDKPTLITKEECDQCPNMRWVVGSNFCAPNLSDRVYHGSRWEIITNGKKSTERLTGGMVPFSTKCTELTPDYGIGVSAKECSYCSNTYMKDGFCFGKE